MSPVIPHLTNEVIEKFNSNKNIKWPEINKEYLVKEDNLVVIQVNGKKRNIVTIKEELEEKELVLLIKSEGLIKKYLDNGELVKIIYIKNKLINFIIK